MEIRLIEEKNSFEAPNNKFIISLNIYWENCNGNKWKSTKALDSFVGIKWLQNRKYYLYSLLYVYYCIWFLMLSNIRKRIDTPASISKGIPPTYTDYMHFHFNQKINSLCSWRAMAMKSNPKIFRPCNEST